MSKPSVERTNQKYKSRGRRSDSAQPYPPSPTGRRRSSISRNPVQVSSSAKGGKGSPPPAPATPAVVREIRQEARQLMMDEGTLEQFLRAEEEEEEELSRVLAGEEWAQSEVLLFTKMRRRGKEPLFPETWKMDFATFPDILYCPVGQPSYIGAINNQMDFRGIQAFQNLLTVGGQVRDRIEVNPSMAVEPLIFHAIQKAITWVEKDSERSLSGILTVAYNRDRRGTSTTASEKVEKRMRALATGLASRNHKRRQDNLTGRNTSPTEASQPAVVIYGITVFNCVAALSTLNSEKPHGDVKNIVVLDWSDRGLDLWNAIGIALLIITARNDILNSDEDAILEVKEQPDEDA